MRGVLWQGKRAGSDVPDDFSDHGECRCGEIDRHGVLLLGEKGVDDCGQRMRIAIRLIMVMRDIMITVNMFRGGMRPVAVVHLGDVLALAMVAQPTAMQAKRLRPANREERDEAKGDTLGTREGHAGGN